MYGNEGNAKNRDKFNGPCRLLRREKKESKTVHRPAFLSWSGPRMDREKNKIDYGSDQENSDRLQEPYRSIR